MKMYEEKLIKYIKENDIPAKHLAFKDSCHSVSAAAKAANISPELIVKSICMIDSELVAAIVKGEDRASTKRVSKALGASVRIATPDEIFIQTGYPVGGVPPFGFNARFFIDPKVMEMDVVYAGGGSSYSLVQISADNLQKTNKGEIVRIRK